MAADSLNQSTHAHKPKVFISFVQEEGITEAVAELQEWLQAHGVEVESRLNYQIRPPKKGWQAWMQHSCEDADLVLVVATKSYKQQFEKRTSEQADDAEGRYQGALLNQQLLNQQLENDRIFPILPDDGQRADIPLNLADFYGDWHFPSGNANILSLIFNRDMSHQLIPNPLIDSETTQQSTLAPGKLTGPQDKRLQPTEKTLVGRSDVIAEVVNFLTGQQSTASVFGDSQNVVGSGGIGKTEICKASLKAWLQQSPDNHCYWVQVQDNPDVGQFIQELALAVGIESSLAAQMQNMEQLLPQLPLGLYYLDNLEQIAESNEGIQALKQLEQHNGIRLLASSRVPIDNVFTQPIPVKPFAAEDALTLFLQCWNGDPITPEQREQTHNFVHQELGGHALSISLLAKLGRYYSVAELVQKWQEIGTSLAKQRHGESRSDNLDISIALTQQLVAKTKGALDLWQFAALFKALPLSLLQSWEQLSAQNKGKNAATDARQTLIDHHILTRVESNDSQDNDSQETCYTMLPPLARYALSNPKIAGAKAKFNWDKMARRAYEVFIVLSKEANKISMSKEVINSRHQSSQMLWSMERLVGIDSSRNKPNLNKLKQLHHQLFNVYQDNPISAFAFLNHTKALLQDTLSYYTLGKMYLLTSRYEQARFHTEYTIKRLTNTSNKLLLAQAINQMSEIYHQEGNIPKTREYLKKAQELFTLCDMADSADNANNYIQLAELNFQIGDVDLAKSDINKAQKSFSSENDNVGLGSAYELLGRILTEQGSYDDAGQALEKAFSLAISTRGKLGQANILVTLSYLAYEQNNYHKADNLAQQAWPLYQQIGEQLGQANVLRIRGSVARKQKQYAKAKAHLNDALTKNTRYNSPLGIAVTNLSLGSLLHNQDQQPEALVYLHKALSTFIKQQNFGMQARTYRYILLCHQNLQDLDPQSYLDLACKAVYTSLRSNLPPQQIKVAKVLQQGCGHDPKKLSQQLQQIQAEFQQNPEYEPVKDRALDIFLTNEG